MIQNSTEKINKYQSLINFRLSNSLLFLLECLYNNSYKSQYLTVILNCDLPITNTELLKVFYRINQNTFTDCRRRTLTLSVWYNIDRSMVLRLPITAVLTDQSTYNLLIGKLSHRELFGKMPIS